MAVGKFFLPLIVLGWCGSGAWSAPPARDHPDGSGKMRSTEYTDPLPESARARMGSTFLRHGAFICALAFSADGKILASGDMSGTVHVWDLARSCHLCEVPGRLLEPCLALS